MGFYFENHSINIIFHIFVTLYIWYIVYWKTLQAIKYLLVYNSSFLYCSWILILLKRFSMKNKTPWLYLYFKIQYDLYSIGAIAFSIMHNINTSAPFFCYQNAIKIRFIRHKISAVAIVLVNINKKQYNKKRGISKAYRKRVIRF